jgi:hypothetical protein
MHPTNSGSNAGTRLLRAPASRYDAHRIPSAAPGATRFAAPGTRRGRS